MEIREMHLDLTLLYFFQHNFIGSPDIFRLLLSSCLDWKIYCDDHSSLYWLSHIT